MVDCPSFSETVLCEMDGEYKIAQGWTQSTGQDGRYPYNPPMGWEFDLRYSDIRGMIGSHGGCQSCIMTLVHLITVEPIAINLCEDVICNPTCDGYDRYDTVCSEGICIRGALIEENSSVCGYVPPDPGPEPDPEPDPEHNDKMNVVYIAIIMVFIYIITR